MNDSENPILNECSICLKEEIPEGNKCITNCSHNYCKECLDQWFDQGKTSCPICRQQIQYFTHQSSDTRVICVLNSSATVTRREYQYLMNIRRNGELMKNSNGKVTSHIYGMFFKIANYLSLNITPIFIFDGKPPDAKSDVIKERKEKADNATIKKNESTTKEEKEKHDKMSIRLTKEYIIDIKLLLSYMGVSYLHIDGEAEAIASELCRIGYVDYVITEDMDSLTFGCPNLIRNCMDKSLKRKDMISIINLDTILKDMDILVPVFS